jgi:hypothetical protein
MDKEKLYIITESNGQGMRDYIVGIVNEEQLKNIKDILDKNWFGVSSPYELNSLIYKRSLFK